MSLERFEKWLWLAVAVLLVWLFIWAPAHAASGPPAAQYTGPVIDLYSTGAPLPESRHFDLALGDKRPNTGMAEVIIEGWDLDEPAEGGLQVGSCAPVMFPVERMAAHDSADGALTLSVPAVCFRPEPGKTSAAIVVTHAATLGFRLTGMLVWLPVEPTFAPAVSLQGWLQNEGILPFVPVGPPRITSIRIGWGVFGTQGVVWCAESLDGKRAPRTTTVPLIVRRATGADARLGLMPEACPEAWAACWPDVPVECTAPE